MRPEIAGGSVPHRYAHKDRHVIARASAYADRGLKGPKGFLATSQWLCAAFTELRFEHFEVLAEDERVAVLATMTGRHTGAFQGLPPTNHRFAQRQFHLFRLRAGQIVEHAAQRDDLGLLLHLGWRRRGEK